MAFTSRLLCRSRQLDAPHWRPVRKLCTHELLNGSNLHVEVRRMVGELYGKAGVARSPSTSGRWCSSAR
ncbi:hypothetical protein QJS10_CPB11g00472 [Acorus calamus]|uniref:Uncharacterized protein n=1 Tax=Acorus calamus TaxID=4465 RepID=A0AAV9DX42_ACOCL|nr:hypothetical protein QJS10_CPB11g00472 [Acorus calamus]